ncbi:hypothetical protein [Streptomyces sp. NPDC046859]|uniref:hypothetical protein n=1 Tax=Streptomyces sp. NPDC046859 TaxID=3155734 RepID=UPI00340EC450
MDFLLLLPHGVRVVLELDGQRHYSVNGKAIPSCSRHAVSSASQVRRRTARTITDEHGLMGAGRARTDLARRSDQEKWTEL